MGTKYQCGLENKIVYLLVLSICCGINISDYDLQRENRESFHLESKLRGFPTQILKLIHNISKIKITCEFSKDLKWRENSIVEF